MEDRGTIVRQKTARQLPARERRGYDEGRKSEKNATGYMLQENKKL